MRNNDYPGTFIVLEGLDGSGTTTQVKKLAKRLRDEGYEVKTTAEPSGGPIGQLLRKYLGGALPTPPKLALRHMMTLLFSADRIEHLSTGVGPALRKGAVVLCDRYAFSTYAYQTDELDDFEWITVINRKAILPDITILLEVAPEVGMARVSERCGHNEIYERLDIQQRVAANYAKLRSFPQGTVRALDGAGDPEDITNQLLSLVRPYIKEQKSNDVNYNGHL